jgi:hypothetical protein
VIQASGQMHIPHVPKDGECGTETDAERNRRKVRMHFVQPFLREQFVSSQDKNTLNRIIEAYHLLWLKFDTRGEVPLERAAAAVIDAMMGYYDSINSVAGTLISSQEEFDAFITQLWKSDRTGPGRRPGRSASRSYTADNFWTEEARAREDLSGGRPGKILIKDVADKMGICEWLYYYYRRQYPR